MAFLTKEGGPKKTNCIHIEIKRIQSRLQYYYIPLLTRAITSLTTQLIFLLLHKRVSSSCLYV